jgi:hypothetical protein
MSERPTYEELAQRVKLLEKEASGRKEAEEILLKAFYLKRLGTEGS